LEEALSSVITGLDYWTCAECHRIYDSTIRQCECRPQQPVQASQSEWMTETAARVYLKELGESTIQSLRWAHEPKLHISPADLLAHANAPPNLGDFMALPPRARQFLLQRHLAPAIRQLKPRVADSAIEYFMRQGTEALVHALTDRSVMEEKLEMAIRATVPAFTQRQDDQPPAPQLTPLPAPQPQPATPQMPPLPLPIQLPPCAGSETMAAQLQGQPAPLQMQAQQHAALPAQDLVPLPAPPGPTVHRMDQGDTPRQPATSAPATPAQQDIPAFRQSAQNVDSPSIAGPDDKRQKAGTALAPFKIKTRAGDPPVPDSPAASGAGSDL
jgi:hypothetical protein